MKRKTLLFSFILAMVIISLALCGADAPDGNISMDEDDFVELVVDAPLSLHYLESIHCMLMNFVLNTYIESSNSCKSIIGIYSFFIFK